MRESSNVQWGICQLVVTPHRGFLGPNLILCLFEPKETRRQGALWGHGGKNQVSKLAKNFLSRVLFCADESVSISCKEAGGPSPPAPRPCTGQGRSARQTGSTRGLGTGSGLGGSQALQIPPTPAAFTPAPSKGMPPRGAVEGSKGL